MIVVAPSERPDARVVALAYEESLRQLESQREDLERFRNRAVGLISAASLSAGLLAGFHRDNGQVHKGWLYVGVTAYIALIVAICVVLWPREMTFVNNAKVILDDSSGDDLGDTQDWLARSNAGNFATNEEKLGWMLWAYIVAIVGLAISVVALLLAFVV